MLAEPADACGCADACGTRKCADALMLVAFANVLMCG